jgi:hypothetical protein
VVLAVREPSSLANDGVSDTSGDLADHVAIFYSPQRYLTHHMSKTTAARINRIRHIANAAVRTPVFTPPPPEEVAELKRYRAEMMAYNKSDTLVELGDLASLIDGHIVAYSIYGAVIADLTEAEAQECFDVGMRREVQKVDQAIAGDPSAFNTNGQPESFRKRTSLNRLADAYLGALTECICSKCLRCPWLKEMGQHNGNSRPDLLAKKRLNGTTMMVEIECRGTRSDRPLFRIWDQGEKRKSQILVAMIVNNGRLELGWVKFSSLVELWKANRLVPKKVNNGGAPAWTIDPVFFSGDFSDFLECK